MKHLFMQVTLWTDLKFCSVSVALGSYLSNISVFFTFVAAALDPPELYRSNLAKKSSSQFAVTMAIKKLAKSTSEAAAAIDQYSQFIEKRGLFGDPEAKWSALNGKTSAGIDLLVLLYAIDMSEINCLIVIMSFVSYCK